MVEINYPNGAVALRAMTVAELIVELQRYPQDLPVAFNWEGQTIGFDEGRMSVSYYQYWGGFGPMPEDAPKVRVLGLYAEMY